MLWERPWVAISLPRLYLRESSDAEAARIVADSLTLALANTASRGRAGRRKVPAAVHCAEPGRLRPAFPVCKRLPGLRSAAGQCRLLRLSAGVLLSLRPHVL